MGQTDCKLCGGGDTLTDTIKVGHSRLPEAANATTSAGDLDREPRGGERTIAELHQQREEERLRREHEAREEENRRQREELEERRQREEQDRAAAEEAARQREQEDKDAAFAAAVARAEAEEAAEAEERARHEQEMQSKLTAEADAARRAAEEKVAAFLATHRFKGISIPRKSCFKSAYPLHVAVEENNLEAVKALLLCGADPSAKNSSGKTPKEWAQKLNKKGSRSTIVSALA
mmetsp:Transcript_29410/g.84536  ORF Transcript_29410/g.84536 Transcript_29410/m.84536 type:complete len:234 (-) Transcript_29410:42-743(-)